MGLLIDGVWHDRGDDTERRDGRFARQESAFRHWITADGAPGPSGAGGFAAAPDRYHLYVSAACPWAHRTLIMRHLKGLEAMLGVTVVHWHMAEQGWPFRAEDGADADPLFGAEYLHQIYRRADPHYTGRVTVPTLFDKQRGTIVSNESAEILRMLNTAFDDLGARAGDYYPAELRGEIDGWNARIYDTVNNGVYKAGFATTQAAYEEAVTALFETLDALEAHLATRAYLVGGRLTEADIRLFTTLVRFDPVYVGHFKCNWRRIADYPALLAYLKRLWAIDAFWTTTDFGHIKRHYYVSHTTINPTGIVPVGPAPATWLDG
ncbi:MAG: glutathione S-transferase family protein [Alphaproteobacteria bacterium]